MATWNGLEATSLRNLDVTIKDNVLKGEKRNAVDSAYLMAHYMFGEKKGQYPLDRVS